MSNFWKFPRWRRIAMQGAMVLVLAATTGLAAVVNREVRSRLRIDLTPPARLGAATFQLPAGWEVAGPVWDGKRLVLTAQDLSGGPGRGLVVIQDRVGRPTSALDYVELHGDVTEKGIKSDVVVGGVRGVRITGMLGQVTDAGVALRLSVQTACVVLPGGWVFEVRLERAGRLTRADQRLMDAVLAHVSFAPPAAAVPPAPPDAGARRPVLTPEELVPDTDADEDN